MDQSSMKIRPKTGANIEKVMEVIAFVKFGDRTMEELHELTGFNKEAIRRHMIAAEARGLVEFHRSERSFNHGQPSILYRWVP
jgi:predicted ArsR family transcriptional regulator